MSLKHKVLSGLMAAALSASLLACSSAPAPAASSAPASSLPSVSQQTETPSYAYQRGTVQNTRYGTLEGFSEDGALHWFGVPYAQAPVNELRWKAPQPLEPWEGTLDATQSTMVVQSDPQAYRPAKTRRATAQWRPQPPCWAVRRGRSPWTSPARTRTRPACPSSFISMGGNNQTGKSAAFPATQFRPGGQLCGSLGEPPSGAAGVQRASRHPDRYGGRRIRGILDCWIWPPLWTGWRRTLRVSAETAGTSPSPAPLREAAM